MKLRNLVLLSVMALACSILWGCASSGYSGIIPIAGPAVGQDTPARRLAAMDAAEQVLLSKGYDPLRVEKEKGYMKFVRQVDSDTAHHVNVRLIDVQSGKNDVEMDVDVRILRERYERSTGVSVGGGFGIGTGGSGFGIGVSTPTQEWDDDEIKFDLKKEIAAAVEQALATQQ